MINTMDLWRILGCDASNGSLMIGTIVKPKLGMGPGRSERRPCLLVARRLHLGDNRHLAAARWDEWRRPRMSPTPWSRRLGF